METKPALEASLVQEFVGNAHGNFARVKELLEQEPALVNATWDWGGGEFETGIDIDEALRRVRDKVNQTKPKLPSDILEPIISEINFSEFPIMFVTLGGDLGLARMKRIAEDLQDKIEAVPGVLSSDITGSLEPEVQVNCDINRLKGYSVSFDDVINAIRSENLTTPGGAINNGTTEYSVRIPGPMIPSLAKK